MPDVLWEEDYLLDLTKPYHNLLGLQKNGESQTFYYDNNVTAMEENGHFHYYLQDELGSPLRVSNWEPPKNRAADSHKYLTYGYDEFGNDPGKELEQAGIPNPYSRQGQAQPFGYTGYRYDDISSTYFAQAREYQPKTGRFTAEDIIKGNGLIPETLNPYVYCYGNAINYVDKDGRKGYYFYDPDTFDTLDMEGMVNADIELLEKQYDTEIEIVLMDSESNEEYSFENAWAAMDDSDPIDIVVIFSHSGNNGFIVDTGITNDEGVFKAESTISLSRSDIESLTTKDIDTLVMTGCNTGLDNSQIRNYNLNGKPNVSIHDYSLAEAFLKGNNSESIGRVIASDGSIRHSYVNGNHTLYSHGNINYHANIFDKLLNKIGIKSYDVQNRGFRIFNNKNGEINSYDMEYRQYLNIVSLLNSANEMECVE